MTTQVDFFPLDCLIVGGGLLGAATAWYLAQEGMKVALIDKGQINSGASGQNAGSLHFQMEYRMIENGIEAAQQAAEAIPLHLDAMHRWKGLETELAANFDVNPTGGLMVAETREQVRLLEQKAALERAAGLEVELLDRPALDRIAPYLSPSVQAATFCAGEGKADPKRAVLAFARAAQRCGAHIESDAMLSRLERHPRGWRAILADGRELTARSVAVTAGAWSGRVAAMADIQLPITPVGLTMSVTLRTPPLIAHLVQHAGRRLSLKQTADGQVLIGGGWPARLRHTDGVVDLDSRPALTPSALIGNMAAAIAVVPAARRVSLLRVWTGITALVADQLPLLGEIPKAPGIFIAVGGAAFTLGPTYARMLADCICGRSPSLDIRRFSPDRFGSLTFA